MMHHPVTGFEHLHRHSDFSLLDGFAKVHEYAERQKEINQKFLCITDHGVMGAVPQQITECEKHNLYPLFGCEMYVNSMQPEVETRYQSAEFRKSLGDGTKVLTPEQQQFDKSNHLLGIAYTNEGYKNLVRLTSWAWIHGFYRKPRVNHDVLKRYKEGIIFTSTCGNSEIANAYFGAYKVVHSDGTKEVKYRMDEDAGFQMLERYIDMFGRDHFYLELMMLDWKMQKPYDRFLIKAHEKYGLPLILTQDCFVEDTLVLTSRGLIPIQSVVVGDNVWTHKNRWREVEVVGSRSVKKNESVYRVKTKAGTYAYEATGNHEMYVANQNELGEWLFSWKRTDELQPDKDHLLLPNIRRDELFAKGPLESIDLMPFLEDYGFQTGEKYASSSKGNMGCRLQFSEKSQEFWSYRGWDRKHKTTIPRMLPVDQELLEIIGWYMAEGWSEKKSNQVGFALHKEEQHVADWLIDYFGKFNIEAKTYSVSENGIAVRFSSVVFNNFFGELCGWGANNKHFPCVNGTWMKRWSLSQIQTILRCYWRGDGSRGASNAGIQSTSKQVIYEAATVFLSCGIVSVPCVSKSNNENWSDSYSLSFTGVRWCEAVNFLMNKEFNFPSLHRDVVNLREYFGVPIKSVEEVDYRKRVYCFQVKEDHSFVSNLHINKNCHYCRKEHSHNQRLMLMQQNRRTIHEINALIETGEADDLFELQDTNLWLKSEDELNAKWEHDYKDIIDYELYKQAKENTVKLAEIAKGVQIDRSIKLPKIPDSDAVLWEEIKRGFLARGCEKSDKYFKRIREEYDLICEKGFSSYFIVQKMMTDEARLKGPEIIGFGDGSEAVGPGRGCVVFNTPIYTNFGQKMMGNIKAGDEVLCRDGKFHVVENVFDYDVSEDLISIKCFYGDNVHPVTLTKDHKILVEKGKRPKNWENWSESTRKSRRSWENPVSDLNWVASDNVEVGDWVFLPTPEVEEISEIWDELNEEWALILGLFTFTGDGWLESGNEGVVKFCFHSDQNDIRDYVNSFFVRIGCKTEVQTSFQGKKVDNLIVKSRHISMLFRELFDGTKHVPDCIKKSGADVLEAYLHGCFLADGREDDGKMKFTTTSDRLAREIRFLLLRINIPSTLQLDDRKDDREDFKNKKPAYEIVCPLDSRVCSRNYKAQYGWRIVEGGLLLQVREIEKVLGVDKVYDIQVSEQHNYCTSSFVVHNSQCGSLVAYCLRLHDVEPIIHDLRFSRFLSPARGGKQMKIRHSLEPIPHGDVQLHGDL